MNFDSLQIQRSWQSIILCSQGTGQGVMGLNLQQERFTLNIKKFWMMGMVKQYDRLPKDIVECLALGV